MSGCALIVVFTTVVTVCGCAPSRMPIPPASNSSSVDQTAKDDAAIDAAVLEGETPAESMFVIVDTTSPGEAEPKRFSQLDWTAHSKTGVQTRQTDSTVMGDTFSATRLSRGEWDELGTSIRGRNAKPAKLAHFAPDRKLNWVTEKDIAAVFERGFWDAFHKKFPNTEGVVSFSCPGYSKDRSHALVFFTISRGGKDGQGSYFLLERTKGKWRVLASHLSMIS